MPTAVTFDRFGGSEVLAVTEVALPEPAPHEVRVKVRAAGVNPLDNKIRRGDLAGVFPVDFPVVPGVDAAGVVDAVGADVTGITVGDEVFGVTPAGSYAEYALMPAPVAKPAALSWELAAALPTVGETAFRALKHLGLESGQTLLVHGAAGSVGAIAVQLAAARGVTVIGTASATDLDRVNALGATAVTYGPGWPERVRAAAPQGVDAVFDTSGAGVLPESVDLAGGPDRVITIADMYAAQYGVRFTGMDPADRALEALPELAELAASGRLTVEIWRTYPLTEAAQAQDDIDHRRNHGKIILLPAVPTHADLPGIEHLARRFYQAFDTADPDLLDQVLAQDWTPQPPVPGNPGGPEGQKQTLRFLHSVFEDLRYQVDDVVVEGSTVAVRARLSGRQVGEFLGVPATGRRIEMTTMEFHQVHNGRITTTWHLEDFFGAQLQMAGTPPQT